MFGYYQRPITAPEMPFEKAFHLGLRLSAEWKEELIKCNTKHHISRIGDYVDSFSVVNQPLRPIYTAIQYYDSPTSNPRDIPSNRLNVYDIIPLVSMFSYSFAIYVPGNPNEFVKIKYRYVFELNNVRRDELASGKIPVILPIYNGSIINKTGVIEPLKSIKSTL